MSDPEYAVKLTVVLPIFNEIGSLSELDRQLSEAITSLGFPCEVVCVDDGSTDGSWARLQELSSSEGTTANLQHWQPGWMWPAANSSS